MTNTQKILLIIGIGIVLIALAWPWISKIPFGKLPGDLFLKQGNTSFYFPLASCILLSLVFSVVMYLFRKFLQ